MKIIEKKEFGKRLYEEMLKYAKEQKVDSIELIVGGFNKKAINFYTGLMEMDVLKQWENGILLKQKI